MTLHQLIPKVPSKSSCSPFQIILAVVRTRKEGILFRYVPSSTPLFFMLKICQCLCIWLLNISAGNKTLKPSVGFFRLVPKIVHIYINGDTFLLGTMSTSVRPLWGSWPYAKERFVYMPRPLSTSLQHVLLHVSLSEFQTKQYIGLKDLRAVLTHL